MENSDYGSVLELAAVQLEIHFSDYSSSECFWSKIDRILEEIVENGCPDIIVFPEYTGVFYTLIPYTRGLSDTGDLETAVRVLSTDLEGASIPEDLFYLGKSQTEEYIQGWSSRAALHSVFILAGTVFYPVDPRGAGDTELRNRALVFDRRGELYYTQDKVYLTDFETDICNLSPGEISAADGFKIDGRRIYLTICRDTYFASWEKRFSLPGFLWIDIKANGEVFNRVQQASFTRALPARLPDVPVEYGLTVCLVGDYLDLLWEGESSLLRRSGWKKEVVRSSENWNREEILYFDLTEY